MTLLAVRTAYRISGLYTKYTAQQWGLRHLSDAAEHVAVELIALAVETTGNPAPNLHYTELDGVPIIGLCVSTYGPGLRIEVWDTDVTPPSHTNSHLRAVEDAGSQWDCYHPRSGGKVIRAQLGIAPLPRRTAHSISLPDPETPIEPVRDLDMLKKVLDGLHSLDFEGVRDGHDI
ncbi:MAG: hypothetical protein ACRDSR_07260 [Pseudonocardiaceae bacterium]